MLEIDPDKLGHLNLDVIPEESSSQDDNGSQPSIDRIELRYDEEKPTQLNEETNMNLITQDVDMELAKLDEIAGADEENDDLEFG